MSLEIKGQAISGVRLLDTPREYQDIHMTDVALRHCQLIRRDDTQFLNVVRNARLQRCRMEACSAQGVYFDEVIIDNLKLAGLHRISGCVFRHVTLRGNIGPIMLAGPPPPLPDYQERVTGAVQKYNEVDWALDTREAIFAKRRFFSFPGI